MKRKSVGDYSGIPYVCTLLNCMLWVVYGLPIVKFQVLVVTINAAGCAIEFTYLTLYLIHAAKKIRVRNLRMHITPIFSAIILSQSSYFFMFMINLYCRDALLCR